MCSDRELIERPFRGTLLIPRRGRHGLGNRGSDGQACEMLQWRALIKSDKWPFLTKLAIATVSPNFFVVSMPWSVPLVPFLPVPSFLFRSFLVTKLVTSVSGRGECIVHGLPFGPTLTCGSDPLRGAGRFLGHPQQHGSFPLR